MTDSDHLFIRGFGFSNYRSFGPQIQQISLCKKVNLIVGQNNSGKSNILRFIQDRYSILASGGRWDWSMEGLESHRSTEPTDTQVSIDLELRADVFENWRIDAMNRGNYIEHELKAFWDALTESGSKPLMRVPFTIPLGSTEVNTEAFTNTLVERLGHSLLRSLSMGLTSSSSSEAETNARNLTRNLLYEFRANPAIITIPSIRQWGSEPLKDGNYNGSDIIHRIAVLQNPEHHQQERRKDFRRIEGFLKEVTDRPEAQLEVPYTRDTLTVHMDGRSLPLEALGTGIHQVVILAAAATTLREHVICIEEPEQHLHPLLQKKLLRYLQRETTNQYFISTHSAHFLDHEGAAIFHVRLTDKGSVVERASSASQKFSICTDLGYHASDLLQTNCIIWVEGPSDLIYIRRWLELADPDLVEGIDFSIMFYGGRLLSHLSPNDPEIDDFISLRRLNRNMVVIMDSDCSSARSSVNATKARIRDSWQAEDSGFGWITEGREIENYVSPSDLVAACDAVEPALRPHILAKTRWSKCLQQKNGRTPDKVKIARWLVENDRLVLDRFNLRARIEELAGFIRSANSKQNKTIASH